MACAGAAVADQRVRANASRTRIASRPWVLESVISNDIQNTHTIADMRQARDVHALP